MRLGGPVFGDTATPEKWVEGVRRHGYGAAYCPVDEKAPEDAVRAYETAAREANIVIAEVGAWSNPLDPDPAKAASALAQCKEKFALADRIGARCCVNISGSCGEPWDGPHADNLTQDTFDRIVAYVRDIVDTVKPLRTFYTLEPMPWMYPDSADSYLALLKAIDRERFGVHLDPANLLCSPQRYYGSGALIRECFEKLGPHIRSCHAKDIALSTRLTTHLDEVRAGLGGMDYRVFLRELDKMDGDMPLMLEHLSTPEDYHLAAEHIRGVAKAEGLVPL
ncbi:MAG: sugar phosphate isomerase/epimerase [FCB group bacterium]|jgi:sugar phosphate isomerase/epimerase|nr:sugar phosphate isomerase/epimerase [FCB group bacterium]